MLQEENTNGNDKHRFVVWLAGPILLLMFAIGTIFAWRAATAKVETIASSSFWGPTVMFLILPWFLTLWSIKISWPVVTLDETGIRRSLFGIFFRRKISWEELYEIRLKPLFTGGSWLFFSKKSLENMSLGKARSRKWTIQVAISPRLIKAIRQFTDKEIINLPAEEINKAIKLEEKIDTQEIKFADREQQEAQDESNEKTIE